MSFSSSSHHMGDPIVLWRNKHGEVVCLLDMCPHRSAELSVGVVTPQGELECKYHGWQFGKDGVCTHIPSIDTKPTKHNCAVSYPSCEKWGIVWVWPVPRDPEATLDKLPARWFEEYELKWHATRTIRDLDLHFSLVVENVLDPAHVPFTHTSTFGNRKDAQPIDCEILFDNLDGKKGATDELPSLAVPNREIILGKFSYQRDQKKHEQNLMSFHTPNAVWFCNGIGNYRMVQIHIAVPITHEKTRVVSSIYTDFPVFKWLPKWFHDNLSQKVFDEDGALLSGQQRNFVAHAEHFKSVVPADKLSVRFRRWWEKQEKRGGVWFSGYDKLVDIEDITKESSLNSDLPPPPPSPPILGRSGGKDFHPSFKASWLYGPPPWVTKLIGIFSLALMLLWVL